jgi:hypothetical protein
MKERFAKVGLDLNIFEGVEITDPRIDTQPIGEGIKRLWSITYGHVDMLKLFLKTDKKYGFFCEGLMLQLWPVASIKYHDTHPTNS